MGGLLNKKEHVIGPNSKIGLDSNCHYCGQFFSKNTTYADINRHQEICRLEIKKKKLEGMMKELIRSSKDLEEIERISEVSKNGKHSVIKKNSSKSNNHNNDFGDHPYDNNNSFGANMNINPNVNKISNANPYKQNKKPLSNKFDKVKSQSAVREDHQNGMLLFDPLEFLPSSNNSNNAKENKGHKPFKKDSSFEVKISNFNAAYLKDFPFEEKVKQFKKNLQGLKVDWREGYCTLVLDREILLKQSIAQFSNIDPYKELHINFKGEISHDAGGIIREWFTVVFKELQIPDLKLFETSDTADFSYKIHKDAEPTITNLDLFNFIGKIISKALLDNLTINTCFNKLIYKMILDEEILLDDLIFIDKPLYHSLKELLKTENICDLGVYFVVQYEAENKLVSDELIPNGSNILVNNDNVEEYIVKRVEHIQLKDKIFINEIKSGIYSLIPDKLIKIFNSDEFELLLNGQPFIDVYDWKTNTIYKGFHENSDIVENFWNALNSLSQDELSKFLQFCTGSSRVPIGGFSALESNRGNISKFCITRIEWRNNSKNFIRAHTCFNRLDMPDFPNYKLLQEAISFIINNEILGFGVD